jgi:NSS family neurotransmitter:Na+ symporter
MVTDNSTSRTHWGGRVGFILAAAGSAVGLGNIWKFPYITGENGGGAFVLIYLVCILVVGLPILIGELMIGKAAQQSTVPAFRTLSKPGSAWMSFGWMGVAAAFLLLSFYAVVAGWTMHYAWLAMSGAFVGADAQAVSAIFGEVVSSPSINIGWQLGFMTLTIIIVVRGVKGGIELASKFMIPLLILMLIALLIKAATTSGFEEASNFIFGFHTDDLTAGGILEAVGHAFFTLSIGMGAMLAYGSYLQKKTDVVRNGILIAGLDTGIALLACMVLFPITFANGMDPEGGPGLVFKNMPVALMALPGGSAWVVTFFILLFIAALTSAISLLEVAASYFIDDLKWSRTKATIVCGVVIAALGIPSALSNTGGFFSGFFGETSWFDGVDWAVSNVMLPLGGLGIALFVGWRMSATLRREAFISGTNSPAMLYAGWLFLMQWIAPAAVIVVFLQSIGLIDISHWFSDGVLEANTAELITPDPVPAAP